MRAFRCRSWRCAKCAPAVNARDRERLEEAFRGVRLADALFVTLTFDPKRWGGESWRAWKSAGECWKRLRDRLVYEYGQAGKKARLVYVQTWEQHKSGWPHVHALLWCPEIAADCRRRGTFEKRNKAGEVVIDPRTGAPKLVQRWARQVLEGLAVAAGFGPQVDAQFPRGGEGQLASYLVKLASELTGSAVKDQLPVDAPRGFRRLRATPLFLEPARRHSGEWLGSLLLAPRGDVLRELDDGAPSILAAANRAAERLKLWLLPRSVPNANSCSTREGFRSIVHACTASPP